MSIEQETNALRAVRTETEALSALAKSFFAAVTDDPRIKKKPEFRPAATLEPIKLKLQGT